MSFLESIDNLKIIKYIDESFNKVRINNLNSYSFIFIYEYFITSGESNFSHIFPIEAIKSYNSVVFKDIGVGVETEGTFAILYPNIHENYCDVHLSNYFKNDSSYKGRIKIRVYCI